MKKSNFVFKTIACFLAYLTLIVFRASASHLGNATLQYVYAGSPNHYIITYKNYTPCGSGILPVAGVYLTSASLGYDSLIYLSFSGSTNPISLGPCVSPAYISACNGGTGLDFVESIYSDTIILPQPSYDWTFAYSECCTYFSFNNLISSSLPSYATITLDNLNNPVNSSPQYLHPPLGRYCVGNSSSHSFIAFDPDGDSLVYELAPVLDNNGVHPYSNNFVTYDAGFSYLAPTPSAFQGLNPVNALLTFTPSQIGAYAVSIIVKEFRGGILINQYYKVDFLVTINGTENPNYIKGKVYLDSNANQVFDIGENISPNRIIEIQPGNFYCNTNAAGEYSIPVVSGNYTISAPSNYPYYYYSPFSHTASFPGFGDTDSINDFGWGIPVSVQDVRITATSCNMVPGNSTAITLTAKNMGSVTLNTTVNLSVDPLLTITNTFPAATSSGANTASWIINNLQPQQVQNLLATVYTAATATVGDSVFSYAEILPITSDTIPSDNYDTLARKIVSAYDPNYKIVSPEMLIENQITVSDFLDYTIYFQNTGTSPALNVVIKDTLNVNCFISSLEILSASHPYTCTIVGNGIITFSFPNINLPDSGSNETASHGFIRFRILPKSGLVAGNTIENTGYIYFDFNAPIITNAAITTVVSFTNTMDYLADNSNLLVYPVPASDYINCKLPITKGHDNTLKVCNLLGQTFYKLQILDSEIRVNISQLPAGIYIIEVGSAEKIYRSKFVKK